MRNVTCTTVLSSIRLQLLGCPTDEDNVRKNTHMAYTWSSW